MLKLYEKYKNKLVRLSDDVVGVIVGYTDDNFILLLEEGCNPIYSFSLDELDKKDYFIDDSFEDDCESCWYSYCGENDIINKKHGNHLS